MNRRTFVQATLAASAAFSPVAIHAAEAKRRIRVGFLGVAHSHAEGKLKVARASDDWELVGVAEENSALADDHAARGVRILSPESLVQQAEVVVVESPVRDHFRHAKLALSAGRHVHLEKPPTTALAEFRELIELARAHKRLLQMGYMWRYHPGFAKMFEAVRNGWLGQVSFVRATINSLYDAAKPAGRKELAAFRGGAMFELGVHMIDQIVRLLGAPQKVATTLRTHGAEDSLADNTVAVFDFPKALAIVHVNLLQAGAGAQRAFEVIGSNGTVRLQPVEQPTLVMDLVKPAGPYKKGTQTIALPKYERYAPELADLADALRNGRTLGVTAEEELLVHEWILRACEMI